MLLVSGVGPDGEQKMKIQCEWSDGATSADVAQVVVDRDAM